LPAATRAEVRKAVGPSYSPQATDFQPIWNAPGGTITDIEVDPLNRDIVYATNGYEIFKSTNGGGTWRKLSLDLPMPKAICAIGDNRFMFYSSDMGLQYSSDGGNTFNPVPGVPDGMEDAVFFLDTSGEGAVYLALGNGAKRIDVYRGYQNSWNHRGWFDLDSSGGAPRSLWAKGDSVFLGIGGSGGLTESYPQLLVMLSVDGGANWLPFWTKPLTSGNVNDIEIRRTSALYTYMFFITDAGIFYDHILTPNPTGHIDVPAWSEMLVLGAAGDTVRALLGRNGILPGLFYARIYGLSVFDTLFPYREEGITDLNFTQDRAIAGTEGLGVISADIGFQNWQESNDSLLAWTTMGPYSLWSNDTLVYSIDISGRLYRSRDAGTSWALTSLNPLIFGIATAASTAQPEVVYAVAVYLDSTGGGIILRSTDAGETWERMGGFNMGDPAFPVYLIVDPANYNRLWAVRLSIATGGLKASYSTNGGTDWTDITLPDTVRGLDVAPDGRVFWATKKGVYWGTYPNFTNRIDSLEGKDIVGVFFNPRDDRLYAADATSGRLWAGHPANPGTWATVLDSLPNDIYSMRGGADKWGDWAMILQVHNSGPLLISTLDYGRSWRLETLNRNIVCLGMADSGRLIAGTVGNGLRRASLLPPGPLRVWVSANPSSPKLGDSCYVKVEVDRWIPDVPACTLMTEGGDTVPIALAPSDTTRRVFSGAFWTGGLHEGPGAIKATAYDKFGNPAVGSFEIVIGPGVGEFMPGDSVYAYPNPAPNSDYGDYIYFRIFTSTEAEVDVLLYDLEGKPAGMVSGARVTGGLGQAVAMNISKVPSGIYIWRLRARSVHGSQSAEKMGKLAIRK